MSSMKYCWLTTTTAYTRIEWMNQNGCSGLIETACQRLVERYKQNDEMIHQRGTDEVLNQKDATRARI